MKSPKTPAREKPLRDCEPSAQRLLYRQFGQEASAPSLASWCWCLHCEQAFPLGDVRVIPLSDIIGETFPTFACPVLLEDGPCDGDSTDFSLWQPDKWPRSAHPEYPEMPEPGQRYPLA